MSRNHEAAQNALDAFQEEPIFEQIEVEDSYTRRLRVLHELEDCAWAMVEQGDLSATEAEEAIWSCIDWLENTNEEKGCY